MNLIQHESKNSKENTLFATHDTEKNIIGCQYDFPVIAGTLYKSIEQYDKKQLDRQVMKQHTFASA